MVGQIIDILMCEIYRTYFLLVARNLSIRGREVLEDKSWNFVFDLGKNLSICVIRGETRKDEKIKRKFD